MEEKKTKIIHTTLDNLPYGDYTSESVGKKKERITIPEGVHRRSLIRDVVVIAWPSLVELILTQLTSMADQIMVGRLPGEAGVQALSAVGLAAQPKFLLMTMMMSLNVGSTAIIARYRGQQNQEKANQVFRQALLLNLMLGILFMVLGLQFSGQLIRFIAGKGIDEGTLQQATDYLRIQMAGFVPLMITFTTTAALRGIGDSRTPLFYNTVANVVNLIFNYIMIYGKFGCPAMGVIGASWATDIGQLVAFFIAVYVVSGGRRYVSISFRDKFTFDKAIMSNVVAIGIPAMVEQLFMRAGMIIFTRTVTGLGTTLYATHQICMNIMSLSFMIGQAFANSTTTLMGQSLGKRRYDMAVLYMRQTRLVGVLVSLVVAAVFAFFNKAIVGIYNSTPEVVAAGGEIMYLIAVLQPIQTIQFIVSGGLRGAGDTRFSALVTAITVFGVRSAVALFTVRVLHWGLWGAWAALACDQCLRTMLMMYRYNTGKWAHMSLKQMEKSN